MNFKDIATLVISFLSLCGFGVIMKNFWDDKHARKLAETAEHKELVKRQRQDEIREVLKEEIQPINNSVAQIKGQLKTNNEGTVTMIRSQMKLSLDIYRKQGYASKSDKAAWNELYNKYESLGGNHFREYVDGWKSEMDGLPEHEPKKKTKRTKSVKFKANYKDENNVTSA